VADDLVMGRFRIEERIGSGGMATVFRAFDERLQRRVAVKEIIAADPERVLREAQAAARLNHPSIVTLYELGRSPGRALLVSELVAGETLATLRGCGLLCDRDVAEIGIDLCEALLHAHSRGVVHRDLKPENVVVCERGNGLRRAKLMDFGIARVAGAPTLTAGGEVIGTLAYMSPEQADGVQVGAESDLYSLALTAYECWAGRNPIAGRTPAETARRIGAGVPPLRLARPDLPEGLTDTIDACLDPDRALRPTVIDLRDCLEAELDELEASVPVRPGGEAEPRVGGPRLGTARLATICAAATLIILIAVPLASPGLAIVLGALLAPSLLIGAPLCALAPIGAPLLAAGALGGAAATLGAAPPCAFSRAILGAATWGWLAAASLALGLGPDLGLGPAAPDGWSGDAALAVDSVLAPLVSVDALLEAAAFAAAAVVLGWVLRAEHVSIALLGAMLWAAGVDAALGMIGNGALGGHSLVVVAAAALAVGVEFGLVRGAGRTWGADRHADRTRPLIT
jgi:eukaryotic-like serine/threonine-protein kinase